MSRGLSRWTVATVLDAEDQPVAHLHRRASAAVLRRDDMDVALRAAGFEVAPLAANVPRDARS